MYFQESHTASLIRPSPTLALNKLVADLRRAGQAIIDLGAGEPDFDTPQAAKDAAGRAIREGKTKYTANAGALALREAIAGRLNQEHGADYQPSHIVVANGAKQAIYNALLAVCNAGDEVILPAPYWVSYPEQIKLAGARAVIVRTRDDNDFKITPAALRRAITSRSRLLILNSPSNPTGAVYTIAELSALLEVVLDHELLLLSDEIYFKLLYDDIDTCSLCAFPEVRPRLILVNGFSKTYAMTGWRLGYTAAPAAITQAIDKIQSHTTSNACSISQEAGLAALQYADEIVEIMRQEFDRRRRFVLAAVSRLAGVSVRKPLGAFYMFINVGELLGRRAHGHAINSAADLCAYLVREAGVALVSGEGFGSTRHVRLSYATGMKNLQEAMCQLEKALPYLEA